MTTQTTLSDSELIVKGYNAIIADAQYEFEDIKEEVLLQLEDLDEDFDTYREFELRLEAYENGAFDPDIEKILGIGGRKAGTWNPFSTRARANVQQDRDAKRKDREALIADDTRRATASRMRDEGLSGKIDPAEFKGRQPGGGAKGQTREHERYDKHGQERTQYRGGDLSDRDTFAGAIARKVISGRKKLGATKDKLDQRENIGRKIGETKDRTTARVADTGSKAAESTSNVAGGLGRVGKLGVDKTKASAKKLGSEAKKLPGDVKDAYRGETSTSGPYSPTGKYIGNVNKSFTDRLRKSMGYSPRRRYDARMPW